MECGIGSCRNDAQKLYIGGTKVVLRKNESKEPQFQRQMSDQPLITGSLATLPKPELIGCYREPWGTLTLTSLC